MSPAAKGGEQSPMWRVITTKLTVHAPTTLWQCNYVCKGVVVVLLNSGQRGTEPSSQPQRSPTSATDCDSDPSGLTMNVQNRAKGQHALQIAQWNAEGVRLKKTELQHFLKHNEIDVCYIQVTLVKHSPLFHKGSRVVSTRPRKSTKGRTADPGEKQHPCCRNPEVRSS